MSTFQEMMDNLNKTHEIYANTSSLVYQITQLRKEEFDKINHNSDLSPEGKAKQRDAVNKEFAEAFIKAARKYRDEFDQAVVKASTKAEVLLNESPKKPDSISLSTFDREFGELKIKLLLSTNPDTSIKMLEEFVSKNNNPYFAKEISKSFSEIAGNIINSSGEKAVHSKGKLANIFEQMQQSSFTEEQKKAYEVQEIMKDKFGANLFLEGGIETTKLKEMFGPRVSSFANKPYQYTLEEEKTQEGAE